MGYLVFHQIKLLPQPAGDPYLFNRHPADRVILISRVSLARVAERFQLWLYAQVDPGGMPIKKTGNENERPRS